MSHIQLYTYFYSTQHILILRFNYKEHNQIASIFKSQSIISPWDLPQKSVREDASDDQNYLRKIDIRLVLNVTMVTYTFKTKKRERVYLYQMAPDLPKNYKTPKTWNWNNLIFIKDKNLQLILNPSNMTQSIIIYILKDFFQGNEIDLVCPIL